MTQRTIELLAPAGDPEAGYAALHFGADAIYLGLRQFSARAGAVNFTPAELGRIVAYAHSMTPRRRVFVAVNTLVRNAELPGVIATLASVADLAADAVIIQDLGVARLAREYFPGIERHASTQLAIHSLAGAQAARDLGFQRVTLARELTLPEIGDITARAGVETETFIHGALCYGYSGLCLYSSILRGRSGNRGQCTYPCRDLFRPADDPAVAGRLPFSMKDLAALDLARELRRLGVACLKIEGRKKSALYTATVTRLYRAILDGRPSREELERLVADTQTVFSRPWTTLHIKGRHPAGVTDADTVGHRGAPIGRVAAVRPGGRDGDWLEFKTARALEWHDGLQVDVPGLAQPFGFAVAEFRPAPGRGGRGPRHEMPAGSLVAVRLPQPHPGLPVDAVVYCSSSQAVKRSHEFSRPRPADFAVRRPIRVRVALAPEGIHVQAMAPARGGHETSLEVAVARAAALTAARQPETLAAAARAAFGKLGDTAFRLDDLALDNPAGLFVPVSILNDLRREALAALENERQVAQAAHLANLEARECRPPAASAAVPGARQWLLKIDHPNHLAAFGAEDWSAVAELIVDTSALAVAGAAEALKAWAARLDPARIRLALPMITRAWEHEDLAMQVGDLLREGWTRWEIGNLSGWTLLRELGGGDALDVALDWPVYVANRAAAREMLDRGATRFTLMPDDDPANAESLVAEFGDRAVLLAYHDPLLFISENCVIAGLAGSCPGAGTCAAGELELVSAAGEQVRVVSRQCRSITLAAEAVDRRRELATWQAAGASRFRADFLWRAHDPAAVAAAWRRLTQAG